MKTRASGIRHTLTTTTHSLRVDAISVFICLAVLCAAGGLRAASVYDNSVNDYRVRFDPGTLEVGDEIILAGTARYLTNFSFEYWGTSTAGNRFNGTVTARVRFYRNDGAPFNGYATPGTVFYQSVWFPVQPTTRNTLVYSAGGDFPLQGLLLPETNFTWSVQFQGLGSGDAAGVDIYSPIVIGEGYPDYWERSGAGWELKTNNVAPMNFAARLQASEVPVVNLQISVSLIGQILVSWPSWASNYQLETSATIDAEASWSTITSGIVQYGNNYVYPVNSPGQMAFFRLKRQ